MRKKRDKTNYVLGFTDHPLTVRPASQQGRKEKKKTEVTGLVTKKLGWGR